MPQILLIAHAPLASALRQVAEHTFADCYRNLQALDVGPAMSADEVEAAARVLMAEAAPPSPAGDWLVMADVYGATPANAAQRLAGSRVRVLCGVNVPMLWRALCYADQPLDALADLAMQGGVAGIIAPPQPADHA